MTLIQAWLLCLKVQDTKWLSEPVFSSSLAFFFFLLKKEKDKIVSYLSSHPVSIVKENILQYLKKW